MMSLQIVKVNSFIRGYHEYVTEWEPKLGDIYRLKREPQNIKDSNAVAIVRETSESTEKEPSQCHPNILNENFEVLGHVPRLMALWLSKFLKRPINSGKVLIKGKRVNRGGGYGLEIPCEYQFEGDSFSCCWLKQKLNKEEFNVCSG